MPNADASAEDQRRISAQFHKAMLDGCEELKSYGYWPSYFHREVANLGGVRAVKNLLAKKDTSEGFATLYSLGKLDMAVEVFVLCPEYVELFTDEERRIARSRLDAVEFDIEGHLNGLAAKADE